MNRQFLKTLNRLCGEVEHLQGRASEMSGKGDSAYQVYDRIAKAKDSLIEAIRLAEAA